MILVVIIENKPWDCCHIDGLTLWLQPGRFSLGHRAIYVSPNLFSVHGGNHDRFYNNRDDSTFFWALFRFSWVF